MEQTVEKIIVRGLEYLIFVVCQAVSVVFHVFVQLLSIVPSYVRLRSSIGCGKAIELAEMVVKNGVPNQFSLLSCAIAARGSLGRNELTNDSDIDIMIIVPKNKYLEFCTLLVKTRHEFSERIFPQIIYPEILADCRYDMSIFLSAIDSRFLFGDRKIFFEYTSKSFEIICNIEREKLVSMYFDDSDRGFFLDKNSNDYTSFMRGYGGLIDFEYISLVRKWMVLRKHKSHFWSKSKDKRLNMLKNYQKCYCVCRRLNFDDLRPWYFHSIFVKISKNLTNFYRKLIQLDISREGCI